MTIYLHSIKHNTDYHLFLSLSQFLRYFFTFRYIIVRFVVIFAIKSIIKHNCKCAMHTTTNIIFKKVLITDFRCTPLELCSFIRTLMPCYKASVRIQFINVFFCCKGNENFEYTFVFSSEWLNSRSLSRLNICPLNLYRTYSFTNNPTLWQ